ncbi:Protein sip5 [Rasamsonia emersonii CBS 393.64]|uniref:Protein SIP5 n=1 Tax=Rasamsonia emersonii (strain ATCC 16479 / CBS 393.64 / IMI 116815) TaxID=1408163 RepID=A0A0F4YRC7_RASE3|nr:Protein sip5 [Rasamsonia emersonii CBS 393.64]KKA20411.1 Protein sip5 [Rasamsonia emersonii CBS 393.64]
MGNSQTKEARHASSPSRRHHRGSSPSDYGRSPYHGGEGSRSGRASRPDLPFLGIGGTSDRDVASLEQRRETKQEREARRLEKERIARIKERERSMKEEHVDGGYLVTQGVYTGPEDFNKAIVRQFMIERRLAPFWRGLNDFSDSWTEHQLVAAARGLPIPPADQIPPELEDTIRPKPAEGSTESPDKDAQYLTVPISSRSPSFTSDTSQNAQGAQSLPSTSPIASGTSSSPIFRGRAKTLAALATSKGNNADMSPREVMLPHDPFVNGQPIEAYLYKDATECPICFLYYPPYLNRTRCCDQPICSECFVQIKRPEPHPPEHGESNANASSEGGAGGEQQRGNNDGEWQLVSEPAACPFCVQPEFGVTYNPPPFRRGLVYATPNGSRPGQATQVTSPVSSTSSLASSNTAANGSQPATTGRRRATSLSANDPSVITTDMIRPDWAQKLANARAQAARRAAAATALHTAAYLMNSPGNESRNSGGRRGVLRRTGGGGSGSQSPSNYTGSPALHALAFLSERRGGADQQHGEEGNLAPPRGSSRRSRIDDLEEMMMMEAIRQSLASEEERRRKAEKEVQEGGQTEGKGGQKGGEGGAQEHTFSRVESSSSSVLGEESSATGKGKGVERVAPGASDIESGPSSSSPSQFADPSPSHVQPSPTEPSRPSHLRHMSNVSSASSSFVDSTSGEQIGSGTLPNGSNPALEPMFNFRSLAAVIGDEEKGNGSAEHVEEAVPPQAENSAAAEAKPSNSENAVAVEGQPPQEDVASLVPKELEANSVEIPREATT